MMPKHGKVGFFLKHELLKNLSSFPELEARISALPSNKERGDAFEMFAEAYLATQRVSQAKEIWPFETIPASVSQKLRLDTGRDMGVDGVYETPLGEYDAYQVKFRTGRPKLTWDELSTFMGLTDQVSQRVLFTNCDDFPKVMNERTGFFCIRGSDLDRMQKRDFDTILKWLESGVVKAERKKPLPHQAEALDAILPALKQQDRATAVMACGTGKTLVALWAAEGMQCKSVVVLLPSLSLVRQTLHEWLRETSWPELSYLCICSDPSVSRGADSMVVHQSDLDFSVTTNAGEIRQFLAADFPGVRIVFSTYQSAHLLGAAMEEHPPFDLGIFDEAHKTTGREGAKFGLALSDGNLAINKRLFLTATPRHYNINKKNKEGDAQLVYSMDNTDVYGSAVHTLSFAKAAEQGIICAYKVIISVVTSDMVGRELLHRGEVVVDGDAVHAQQVASQIALQQAVEKYGVGKIFTFHSSVASAKSFTSEGGEGVGSHLLDFGAFHVNGAMPTAKREHIMRAFSESDSAVLSNARCLTEGVDLPAVDMVAFMSPKKSKVDIVQATGRAMRKAPNKTSGYVLVPLFLELEADEILDKALERTRFDDIWNVLQAMQEQDEALADVIRQMREDKGRKGSFDDRRLREKVETLGPTLMLDALRESITAACVEGLGITWDERYGELKAYREQFGDCSVPIRWDENKQLANWVSAQRSIRKSGKLVSFRVDLLENIGFDWEPDETAWNNMFEDIVKFQDAYGHLNVPVDWSENQSLGSWVANQRSNRVRGLISQERIERLIAIDFVWSVLDANWEEMFASLSQFKKENGHCKVPKKYQENPKLGIWVSTQRDERKRNTLIQERVSRLEELGFDWDLAELFWREMFAALEGFKEIHGHCNVPKRWPDKPQLSQWVFNQRTAMKQGRLDPDQAERLNSLGFVWDTRKEFWEVMFRALQDYRSSHGHCNVSDRWPENLQLAAWVQHQRQEKKQGQLSQDRINRLDILGFIWARNEAYWEEMFAALIEYKAEFGNCNVPQRWGKNPRLGMWASNQRQARKKGDLGKERITKLASMGFKW